MGSVDTFLQGVSNQSLCSWFYFMYLLALFSAIFQFSFILYSAFRIKNKMYGLTISVASGIALSIAVFQSLFLYSLCDRSLVGDKSE